MARELRLIPIIALSVVLTGCFSSQPEDINAFLKPENIVPTTAKGYTMQPPDEIQIYCSKIPEIHLQNQQIRPDGIVTFETLGSIHAAGKTPEELAEIIQTKVLSLYSLPGNNPIDVRIIAYKSKFFYVLGQVFSSGPKVYTGRDTVLSALAEARPLVTAWVDRIQVVRPSSNKDTRPKIFEVNYDRMTAHGDLSKNVLLQEGDIIFVPPTILAAIALKVEEFVTPIGRAFSTVNVVGGTPAPR